ncbi:hypothetical protein F4861DRAFT_390101 [Xylaria intraflava]|nr:hypothetical protein F4861DRAFT_390101 [Xylaria intraflava]
MEPQPGNQVLNEPFPVKRLPREIQLMISAFLREDRPVVHHYMILGEKGRWYGAFNTHRREFVDTSTRTMDSRYDDWEHLPDAHEAKIRLTGDIMKINTATEIQDLTKWPNDRHRVDPKPRNRKLPAWVNFDKDIFFLGSSYKFDGKLRFLFRGINARMPQPLSLGHWAHRIQYLAMYITGVNVYPLAELDSKAFSQLDSLQKVYLVASLSHSPEPGQPDGAGNDSRPRGLVPFDYCIREGPQRSACDRLRPHAKAIETHLLQIFRTQKRDHITVDLRIDLW